jgi:hypothetical protein
MSMRTYVRASRVSQAGVIADTAGPIALALRGLSGAERAGVRADVEDALARFAAADGYELPCVAVCGWGADCDERRRHGDHLRRRGGGRHRQTERILWNHRSTSEGPSTLIADGGGLWILDWD